MNWKVAIGNVLCHEAVGRVLCKYYSYQIPCGDLAFDVSEMPDRYRAAARMFWHLHERRERSAVRKYLRPRLDVIELGAGFGGVSMEVGRRLAPGQRLVLVEANPLLIPSLNSNIQKNLDPDRIHVVHGAIAYSGATVQLAIDEQVLGSSVSLGRGSEARALYEVPSAQLGQLLEKFSVEEFALVSDIEGMEHSLLDDEPEALAKCQQIIIEVHNVEKDGRQIEGRSAIRRLEEMGFVVMLVAHPVFVLERQPLATASS